jgi:quercetin dioxygenase-like cupin family protein
MKVTHYSDIALEEVNAEGARGAKIRWLIAQKDNAPNFAMRMFEIQPGGFTPYHSHPWEHEVFIVEGEGVFVNDTDEIPFKTGTAIFADPNMKHQFRNTGSGIMRFLCLIPHEYPQTPKKVEVKAVNPFGTGKANNC